MSIEQIPSSSREGSMPEYELSPDRRSPNAVVARFIGGSRVTFDFDPDTQEIRGEFFESNDSGHGDRSASQVLGKNKVANARAAAENFFKERRQSQSA